MLKLSNIRQTVTVILLVVLFFGWGVFIGVHNAPVPEIDKVTGVANKETQVATTADFSTFWKTWNLINQKSIYASRASDQDRVYGAVSGLMGSLNDPYSVFFKPDEAKSFEEQLTGNFGGVGMEVGMKDKIITVIAPLKDTPAFKAGIKSGDKILKIDKASTADMTTEDAIKLMRGSKGTSVTLTILHKDSVTPVEIKIVRDIINIPTLDTEARPDGIFVIKLYVFDANASSLFASAIEKFAKSGDNKLILDLRDNPGGYLNAAQDISSWFVPGGKPIVTEDYGGHQKADILRSKGYTITLGNENLLDSKRLKFVILINGGSASASEIVSGAMQDYGIAKLVGTQSFGKGSVQETMKLTPATLLKITVAKWLTPKGTSISEKGLTPDYKVDMSQKDVDAKKDPQMDKAVQLLLAPNN